MSSGLPAARQAIGRGSILPVVIGRHRAPPLVGITFRGPTQNTPKGPTKQELSSHTPTHGFTMISLGPQSRGAAKNTYTGSRIANSTAIGP